MCQRTISSLKEDVEFSKQLRYLTAFSIKSTLGICWLSICPCMSPKGTKILVYGFKKSLALERSKPVLYLTSNVKLCSRAETIEREKFRLFHRGRLFLAYFETQSNNLNLFFNSSKKKEIQVKYRAKAINNLKCRGWKRVELNSICIILICRKLGSISAFRRVRLFCLTGLPIEKGKLE